MTATRTATKRGRGRAPAAPANPPDVARQLFDANLPLAYHLARKRLARLMPGTRRQAGGIEGMEQTALIGLWAAARGYRADSGVRFSTYAWHTVNGYLLTHLQDAARGLDRKGRAKTYDPADLEWAAEPARPEPACEPEHLAWLRRALRRLRPRDRAVLTMTRLRGGTLDEAARRLGVCRSRAGQLQQQAVASLRAMWERDRAAAARAARRELMGGGR